MGLELNYQYGQTPLSYEEKEGLLIKSISNHGELNEFEQLNIEKAYEWTINNRFTTDKILTEDFIKRVHKKMFSDVWKWAGSFRRSEKNIGVPWINIGVDLKKLLDDTKYWIEHETYSPDEIAIRFKYRLVTIHCFPNGNGRHSRLMADIIIESMFGLPVFSWKNSNIIEANETRREYITALQEADEGNIEPLIIFART